MSEATITSKGQVTIPSDIRKTLGLNAQDKLTFTPMPDGTVVLRAKNRSVFSLNTKVELARMLNVSPRYGTTTGYP